MRRPPEDVMLMLRPRQERSTMTHARRVSAVVAVVLAASGGSYAALRGESSEPGVSPAARTSFVPPDAPDRRLPHLPGMVPRRQSWTAARTDPDPRVVVVSYLGGACDGPARLQATERNGVVALGLTVEHRSGGCRSSGFFDVARVRLSAPLARRPVVDAAAKRPVPSRSALFDGSYLLTPTGLPPGFALVSERGDTDPRSGRGAGALWSRTWAPVRARRSSSPVPEATCDAAPRRSVTLWQGATETLDLTRGEWVSAGTVTVAGSRVALKRQRVTADLAVRWRDARTGQQLALVTSIGCSGQRPYGAADVERIISSLRPVADGRVIAAPSEPADGRTSVTGLLMMTGGVVNSSQLVAGTVMFRDQAGHATTVAADAGGSFTARLVPGTYEVTGRSPWFNAGTKACLTDGPVDVTPVGRVGVLVACSRK